MCVMSIKFLGFIALGIHNEQSAIAPHENALDLLDLFMNILLVERDKRFCNALVSCINLGSVSIALNAVSHVDADTSSFIIICKK